MSVYLDRVAVEGTHRHRAAAGLLVSTADAYHAVLQLESVDGDVDEFVYRELLADALAECVRAACDVAGAYGVGEHDLDAALGRHYRRGHGEGAA